MPYSAEISRTNPSCFLFLIDQSGSMQHPFPSAEGKKPKSEALADAINRLLQNLVIKCAKSEGIRDYYEVGVIGYGGAAVGAAFGGNLAGKELVKVSELGQNPIRVEPRTRKMDDGAGGIITQQVKFPVWFEPKAIGGTPMCEALEKANFVLSKWILAHPKSFPPIVINITDGKPTDGNPAQPAYDLMSQRTLDGEVLLFNLLISAAKMAPIEFPDNELVLNDEFARALFHISSPLPPYMRRMMAEEGVNSNLNSRGFVFNADLVSVIRFLDIGTRPANMR
ncbi:MAG TPA: vWA domain-containing protein [Oculatellaceae cyanobacterium]